jgi:hypothetical protein
MGLPEHENEVARLDTLKSFNISDTPHEQAFDDLARLTSYPSEARRCPPPLRFYPFFVGNCIPSHSNSVKRGPS